MTNVKTKESILKKEKKLENVYENFAQFKKFTQF